MKIDARIVADHLNMVAMGGRIVEVVLGPNFTAQVADEAEEVMMHATVKDAKFGEQFGIMHLGEFAKVMASFGEEADIELKDGKLIMKDADVTVWYQTADVDKIASTVTSFKDADKAVSKEMVVEAEPEEGFLAAFTKYQKLISPDLIEIAVKGKKLVARLISMKGHRAEVTIGNAEMAAKSKFAGFRVSAAAFADVLAGVKPEEENQVRFFVGKVLKVTFRTYSFLVSPQVELVE